MQYSCRARRRERCRHFRAIAGPLSIMPDSALCSDTTPGRRHRFCVWVSSQLHAQTTASYRRQPRSLFARCVSAPAKEHAPMTPGASDRRRLRRRPRVRSPTGHSAPGCDCAGAVAERRSALPLAAGALRNRSEGEPGAPSLCPMHSRMQDGASATSCELFATAARWARIDTKSNSKRTAAASIG